jgi:SHS2 domain-containing protein
MNETKRSVREIDHTADLGFEVEAADPAELFKLAGEALYGLIAETAGIEPKEEIKILATAENWEELLHAWLCELLAQFNLRGFIGKRCDITTIEPGRVEGIVKGEALDLKRHKFHTEIKGVTYHGFKVWQENDRWRARVIFDV